MKESEFKLEKSIDSIEATFAQAEGYYNDVMKLLELSEFDFFNDYDLPKEKLEEKINEKNRRLQTLGQAFELYMKYILLSFKLENDPDISLDDLWGRWIRGHKMVKLINETAEGLIPGFRDIFFKTFNSFWGFGGSNLNYNSSVEISSDSLRKELIPQFVSGFGGLTQEIIDEVIERNTSLYESCRYNIEKPTNYDFEEVSIFIMFIRFFATMVHESENKLDIDYNLAFLKAKLKDPTIKKQVLKYRSIEEINELLSMDLIKQNVVLLAYLLTNNFYSIKDIKELIEYDDGLKDPNNLLLILSKNITIEDLKKRKSNNINTLLFTSEFSFEQIKKIISIPVVGEYINNNPLVLQKLLTKYQSDIGLNLDEWIDILNIDFFKKEPQWIEYIGDNFKAMYTYLYFIDFSNYYWIDNQPKNNTSSGGYYLALRFVENIIDNRQIFPDNIEIPWMIDKDNIISIIKLFKDNGVKKFEINLFAFPYVEVASIVNYMKKNNIPIAIEDRLNEEFVNIKNTNSNCNTLFLNFPLLDDNFIQQNGFQKQKQGFYSEKHDNIGVVTFEFKEAGLPKGLN